jgi:hypothetical protein
VQKVLSLTLQNFCIKKAPLEANSLVVAKHMVLSNERHGATAIPSLIVTMLRLVNKDREDKVIGTAHR